MRTSQSLNLQQNLLSEPFGVAVALLHLQVTPEEAMQRLLQAAGPGAGSPPPEVVGAALKARCSGKVGCPK